MIELIDDQVGRLLRFLEESGQRENTIVIFTSDHGELLGDHGIYLKGPHLYDGSVRVPFLLSWPKRIKAGIVSDALVELVDLAPTLLDCLGMAIPLRMQGRSFLPILTGEADPSHHIADQRGPLVLLARRRDDGSESNQKGGGPIRPGVDDRQGARNGGIGQRHVK